MLTQNIGQHMPGHLKHVIEELDVVNIFQIYRSLSTGTETVSFELHATHVNQITVILVDTQFQCDSCIRRCKYSESLFG